MLILVFNLLKKMEAERLNKRSNRWLFPLFVSLTDTWWSATGSFLFFFLIRQKPKKIKIKHPIWGARLTMPLVEEIEAE